MVYREGVLFSEPVQNAFANNNYQNIWLLPGWPPTLPTLDSITLASTMTSALVLLLRMLIDAQAGKEAQLRFEESRTLRSYRRGRPPEA
jgi:hypothetical protein